MYSQPQWSWLEICLCCLLSQHTFRFAMVVSYHSIRVDLSVVSFHNIRICEALSKANIITCLLQNVVPLIGTLSD